MVGDTRVLQNHPRCMQFLERYVSHVELAQDWVRRAFFDQEYNLFGHEYERNPEEYILLRKVR